MGGDAHRVAVARHHEDFLLGGVFPIRGQRREPRGRGGEHKEGQKDSLHGSRVINPCFSVRCTARRVVA